MVYPHAVTLRLSGMDGPGVPVREGASGKDVNFECGSFIRFSLAIDCNAISDIGFTSNGCGFMLACADVLADHFADKQLVNLHGLRSHELWQLAESSLVTIPLPRHGCISACISALRKAFADHRSRRVEEFRGEKALVCTCFGVTEDTIEAVVRESGVTTVAEVAKRCRAGDGCGSCTMIIQEILDNRAALQLS